MATPATYKSTAETPPHLTDNGTFYTDGLDFGYSLAAFIICAYADEGETTPVKPSAGIATVECSQIEGSYSDATSSGGNPVDLTRIGTTSNNSTPFFKGPIIRSRVTISGVDFDADGIHHFRAFLWRDQ